MTRRNGNRSFDGLLINTYRLLEGSFGQKMNNILSNMPFSLLMSGFFNDGIMDNRQMSGHYRESYARYSNDSATLLFNDLHFYAQYYSYTKKYGLSVRRVAKSLQLKNICYNICILRQRRTP